MAEHFMTFKYLLNRTLDLAGEMFFVPMVMKQVERDGHFVLEPQFDLNKVHRIPLRDEDPALTDLNDPSLEGMSTRTKTDLIDEAHLAARESRKHNDELRTNMYFYVKNGTIEILDDPFKMRALKMGNTTVRPDNIQRDVTQEQIAARPKTARPSHDLT